MKPLNPNKTVKLLLTGLLCMALGSCKSDTPEPAPRSEMSVSFRVQTRSGSGTEPASGYENATEWENYINIEKADYRIAFFDKDNMCITPFVPSSISADEGLGFTDYTLTGEVPGVLTFYSDFKIVILANWGQYPDIKPGVTHIDDLCCPRQGEKLGQFQHFDSSAFTYTAGSAPRYVPMYGVKEYTGVKFGLNNENEPVVLHQGGFGPVNMLRSIAKVEVLFADDVVYELDSDQQMNITNYNDYGYCAPEGAYQESDYYNSSWDADYRQGFLHLVGGANDSGAEKPLAMTKLKNSEDKDVWVAYLPEYRNVDLTAVTDGGNPDCKNELPSTAEVKKARIALPLKRDGALRWGYIDFATYSAGEPDTPINIERNNLYRFTVTYIDPGVKWKVEVLPWNCQEHEPIVM